MPSAEVGLGPWGRHRADPPAAAVPLQGKHSLHKMLKHVAISQSLDMFFLSHLCALCC